MISRFRGANERWKIKFLMNVILRSNFSRVIYISSFTTSDQ